MSGKVHPGFLRERVQARVAGLRRQTHCVEYLSETTPFQGGLCKPGGLGFRKVLFNVVVTIYGLLEVTQFFVSQRAVVVQLAVIWLICRARLEDLRGFVVVAKAKFVNAFCVAGG